MLLNGQFPEALWNRLRCQSRILLQQRQAQSAEAMGPADEQDVSWSCLIAMQTQWTEPPKGADGEQPLRPTGAVPSQENPAMAAEGF